MSRETEITRQELEFRKGMAELSVERRPQDSVANYCESMGLEVDVYVPPMKARKQSYAEQVADYYIDVEDTIRGVEVFPDGKLPPLTMVAKGNLPGTNVEVGLFIEEGDLPVAHIPGDFGPKYGLNGVPRTKPCVMVSGTIGFAHYVNQWAMRTDDSAVVEMPSSAPVSPVQSELEYFVREC